MVRLLVRRLESSPEAVECVGGGCNSQWGKKTREAQEHDRMLVRTKNTEAIIDNQFSE